MGVYILWGFGAHTNQHPKQFSPFAGLTVVINRQIDHVHYTSNVKTSAAYATSIQRICDAAYFYFGFPLVTNAPIKLTAIYRKPLSTKIAGMGMTEAALRAGRVVTDSQPEVWPASEFFSECN